MNLSRKLSQTQCDNVTVFFKPIPCINPARSQFFKLKDCCIQMYSIAIKWIEIINLDNTKLVSLFSMEKKLELIIEWVSWFKHHLQRLYNQQGAHRSHTKKKNNNNQCDNNVNPYMQCKSAWHIHFYCCYLQALESLWNKETSGWGAEVLSWKMAL